MEADIFINNVEASNNTYFVSCLKYLPNTSDSSQTLFP